MKKYWKNVNCKGFLAFAAVSAKKVRNLEKATKSYKTG
jgi:hypothetical protein